MDEYLNDYLAHHGIKGQRWGVRRTPEELGHVTKTKKSNKTVKNALDYAKKKIEERKASEPARKEARMKEYLQKHPDAIYRHRNKLSQSDVEEIMKKVEWDRKCKDIARDEKLRKLRKTNDAAERFRSIANLINQGVNAYNNTALVYNAFYDVRAAHGGDVSNLKKMPRVAWGKKGDGGALYGTPASEDTDDND